MSYLSTRRKALQQLALGSLAIGSFSFTPGKKEKPDLQTRKLKSNINHSVCRWTYDFLSVEELCQAVNQIGFSAIDLLAPKDWPTILQHGIYCSMCYIAGEVSLTKGFNNTLYHEQLVKDYLDV